MMNAVEIGNRISELREKKDLSQSDIALIMDVRTGLVKNWEKGKCLPALSKIGLLTEALEVKPADLLWNEGASKEEMLIDIAMLAREEEKAVNCEKKLNLIKAAFIVLDIIAFVLAYIYIFKPENNNFSLTFSYGCVVFGMITASEYFSKTKVGLALFVIAALAVAVIPFIV